MAEDKFQLSMYTTQIMRIANEQKCSVDTALQYFITNLTTMKEHYKGSSDLNFHEIGQQWNKLLSVEKVAQREEVRSRLIKYRTGGKI